MTRYLIIGNGAAGVAAAERIRRLDAAGEITILSTEPYAVYSRCLLPDFLSGEISEERMYIRKADFYEQRRIRLLRNHRVVKIDPARQHVIAVHGDDQSGDPGVFPYDQLLIASGSVPLQPPIRGLDDVGARTLSTLDDAKQIAAAVHHVNSVIVIGAGFVGLETAMNLRKLGKDVTIIERAATILPGQLDARAAGIIQHAMEAEGIRLCLGTTVTSTHRTHDARHLIVNAGAQLNAGLIIVATGSRPNSAFIRGAGIASGQGILVDRRMRTSVESIYAAGDVVESVDAVTGATTLSPIWPNAVMQGEIAGSNMAGVTRELDPLISMQNTLEFREIPLIAVGITTREDGDEEYVDFRPTKTVYRKVIIRHNVIVGMIFLGDIRNAGVIGALIRQRTDVRALKANILGPNFGYSEVAA